MRGSQICCKQLASVTDSASPFSVVVALGYYDGPTSGVAECAQCKLAYRFDMLDWDEGQDIRIYSLAPLPPDSWDNLTKLLPDSLRPGSVWVPNWIFESTAKETETQQKIDRILEGAGPIQLVIASDGLTKSVPRARQVGAQDLIAGRDWFSFLGLQKR